MMYELKYLPVAQKDLKEIIGYIANNLNAPQAARDLLDSLDIALLRLQQFPYSCRVYLPEEPLEVEYRILPVRNYLIFYIVKENEVEIHRIIFAKMDTENQVK